MQHFITSVTIKKVRHLDEINIPLSKNNAKHLILTGKNGSGKTSVIEMLSKYLKHIQDGTLDHKNIWINQLNRFKEQLKLIESDSPHSIHDGKKAYLTQQIEALEANLSNYGFSHVSMDFSSVDDLTAIYKNGKFILAYFPAVRDTQMANPVGPNKFEPNKTYGINVINGGVNTPNASLNFIQYLVNLKTQKSFAVSENLKDNNKSNLLIIDKIDNWFTNFEKVLKQIFKDDNLKLEFDYINFKFTIKTAGRNEFTFNELSRGYSAIIAIITELMLRMEQNKVASYDVEGIVLIDEIETHLHIELQKNILPLLINFFPNIQFIVTTHSPFVLSSITDSVIFDLENKILVEDLSAYTYQSIIENYFDSDQYSNIIKEKLQRYQNLKEKQNALDQKSKFELDELEEYLLSISSKFASEEIMAQIKHLKLKYGDLNV